MIDPLGDHVGRAGAGGVFNDEGNLHQLLGGRAQDLFGKGVRVVYGEGHRFAVVDGETDEGGDLVEALPPGSPGVDMQ